MRERRRMQCEKGREGRRERRRRRRRVGTEPRNSPSKEAGMRGEEGLWMENEESESGKQFK